MEDSVILRTPSLRSAPTEPRADSPAPEDDAPPPEIYQYRSPSTQSPQIAPRPASPQRSIGASATSKTSADMSYKSNKSVISPKGEQRSPKSLSIKSETAKQAFVEAVSSLERQGEQRTPKTPSIKSDSVKQAIVEAVSNLKPQGEQRSPKSPSIKSDTVKQAIVEAVSSLEPQGISLSEHVGELTESVKKLAQHVDPESDKLTSNIDKIATMSKVLTNEANALRKSIRSLSEDVARTKQELCYCSSNDEDISFPYHLFLVEMIINKIHMKCECFDIDYNNLVISAQFLGKQPIVLYDQSFGKIDNFNKLNVGKSTLFAMTYDKICAIKEFEILLQLTKQPPCSTCVTKIGETRMDYTCDFITLREELCRKWTEEQPTDNILCTTSTPMSKNMYYLSCGDGENRESIGIIEVTVRMSFLGKEITTAFCANPKPQGTSFLLKEDNGMTMYSCQRVEMDDQGKILLDEDVMSKKSRTPCLGPSPSRRGESPSSQISSVVSRRSYEPAPYNNNTNNCDGMSRYDEIFTKMNTNELRIRVPKSSRVERIGKYDKIEELCTCESTPYNAGEQIQFELPKDFSYPDKTYSSNLKYTCRGVDKPLDRKDRKIINVTPTNCPVPVDMQKMLHPHKDVFILKIGKKLETRDKKTDLEIELVTPKAPSEKVWENNTISQQCSDRDIKKRLKGSDKKAKAKGKGAKAGKGKGTKTGKGKKGKGKNK